MPNNEELDQYNGAFDQGREDLSQDIYDAGRQGIDSTETFEDAGRGDIQNLGWADVGLAELSGGNYYSADKNQYQLTNSEGIGLGIYKHNAGTDASGNALGTPSSALTPDQVAAMQGSGGGGGGGKVSPTSRQVLPNGAAAGAQGATGNLLSSLLPGLLGGAFGSQKPQAIEGQDQMSIPGIGQTPGILPQGQTQQSSFAGLLSSGQQPQQQQAQQAPQSFQQAAQDSMQSFTGGETKGQSNPLFQGAVQRGGSSAGSAGQSFQGTPFQAGREAIEESARLNPNQQQQQQALLDPTGLAQGAVAGGLASGAIGGIPAVGNIPGTSAFGQPIAAPGGLSGASQEGIDGQQPQIPGAVTSPTGQQVDFKPIVDPDNENIKIGTGQKQPQQDQPKGVVDPDNDNISLTVPTSKQEPAKPTGPQTFADLYAPKDPSMGSDLISAQRAAGKGFQSGRTKTMVDVGGLIARPFSSQQGRDAAARQLKREEDILAKDPDVMKFPGRAAIGKLGGELGPYMAVGSGAAKGATILGRTLTRAVKGGTQGAVFGAAQYSPTGEKTVKSTLIGSALGSAANLLSPILGKIVGSGAKAVGRMVGATKPTKEMLKKQAGGLLKGDVDLDKAQKVRQAAKRLGVPEPSLGEATGSARLQGMEGRLTPGERGILEATKKVDRTKDVVFKKMEDTIKSTLPKGATPERTKAVADKMYETIKQKPMTTGMKAEIKTNDALKGFMKDAMNVKVSRASNYPEGSVGRLIETEKYLKKLISKGEDPGLAGATIKTIQKIVDRDVPRYTKARGIAQQGIVYNNMMDDLKSIGFKAGEDIPVGDQLYAKFFGNPKAQGNFLSDIAQTGGNAQQAKDLMTVMNSLKGSTFNKIISKDARLFTPFDVAQGPTGTTQAAIRKAFMRNHDTAIIKAMTNPNYTDEIYRLTQAKGMAKDNMVQTVMSRIMGLESVNAVTPEGDIPSDPKVQKDISAQFKNFVDPDKVTPEHQKQQGNLPMKSQIPTAAQIAIMANAKGAKAKALADKIMLMSPKEFNKFAKSFKGRQELLAMTKKYGGDVEALKARFKTMDGMKDVKGVSDPLAAVKAQMDAYKKQPESKTKKPLTAKQKVQAKLAARKVASRARTRLARSRRQIILKPKGSGNGFSARLMSLILSYLTKQSNVQQILSSSGTEGQVARMVMAKMRRSTQPD